MLAAALFAFLYASLKEADFYDWGWRYPFYVAFAINVVELFARPRLVVTPEFTQLLKTRDLEPAPLLQLVRQQGQNILLGAFAPLASYALFCQCPCRPIKFAHTDHRGAGEDELFDRMAPGMAKCAKTLAKCEIVVSGPGRAAFLEHHLGKLGEVRSSVDRPVIGRLVTAQRFGAAFENLRSEEHTSELQSLMRISYAVFCLKKKKKH